MPTPVSKRHDIVVVGSLNHDITVTTPRLPRPGETIVGHGHVSGPGGKGANQAVACARLGADVALVGTVGDDEHGHSIIAGLAREGVDTTAVGVVADAGTGLAVITVDDEGENTIVGVPAANLRLGPEIVDRHQDLIGDARVVIAQLEVPVESVMAAATMCPGIFCLNPAPARPIPASLLDHVDVLVPNRGELGLLAGVAEPESEEEVLAAARRLDFDGHLVVTLGAAGAILVEGGAVTRFEAHEVDVLDTTGAGDAFCGGLAFRLSAGEPMSVAVEFAVAAGAHAVTRLGAQSALPTLADVETLLAR